MKKNTITVFISSQYTKGVIDENVTRQLKCADKLMILGFAPFTPLLYHFQNIVFQKPYEDWMYLSKIWLSKCDCLLRLKGESSGADAEVEFAKANGIPVFYSIKELQEHFKITK